MPIYRGGLAEFQALLDGQFGDLCRIANATNNGDRGTKSKPIPGPHQVYGFLTTAPNAVVAPIR
jgi:hypothetical protein